MIKNDTCYEIEGLIVSYFNRKFEPLHLHVLEHDPTNYCYFDNYTILNDLIFRTYKEDCNKGKHDVMFHYHYLCSKRFSYINLN